jgi:transmembrane sensor
VSTESHNLIDRCAGDWFAKRESGEWTALDEEAFDRWLNESPLHRVAYLRIEHVWERAERLNALRDSAGEVPPPGKWVLSAFFYQGDATAASTPEIESGIQSPADMVGIAAAAAPPGVEPSQSDDQKLVQPVRRGRWPRIGYFAAAASFALAVAAGTAWYFAHPDSYYRTPIGGLESIPMADGSRVTLNTDSAIRVSVTSHARGVELERGEAFFEVAKDPDRPFVVNAGGKRVVAVGTQFSVRRDGDEVSVVVTEGTVRLEGNRAEEETRPSPQESGALNAGVSAAGAPGTAAVLLSAGSVAHAGDAGVLVQEESAAQAEESLSWRQGVLVFHDMTLEEAAAEFNRYNTRQIVIKDPAIAGLRIAGNFRATNVEAFVRLLEHGYPLRVEQQGAEVLLKAR